MIGWGTKQGVPDTGATVWPVRRQLWAPGCLSPAGQKEGREGWNVLYNSSAIYLVNYTRTVLTMASIFSGLLTGVHPASRLCAW